MIRILSARGILDPADPLNDDEASYSVTIEIGYSELMTIVGAIEREARESQFIYEIEEAIDLRKVLTSAQDKGRKARDEALTKARDKEGK